MKKQLIISLLVLLVGTAGVVNAQKQYAVYGVGFYNIENLFDTELDTTVRLNDQFTPQGENNWTEDKYRKKLNNMAFVINQLARENGMPGPAILGVSEVENRRVLEDLVKTGELAQMGLEIVHYDSPDRRGVDVALLYNPKLFTVVSSHPYKYELPGDPTFTTRDQLLVSGYLGDEMVHVIVNHWPSRYGGGKSNPLREHAATLSKHIVDSLYRADPGTKVIIMGDLNDDPSDRSCKVILNAEKEQKDVEKGGLWNAGWKTWDKGIGTLCYQGKWNMFDQIIISEPLLGTDRSTLKFWKFEVFNKDFLITKEGKYKGYPMRTFSQGIFINGYSDHLPVMIYLIKEMK